MLHFFITDILFENEFLNVEEITDKINLNYNVIFDSQTVRNKLNEYKDIGIINAKKQSKKILYSLNKYLIENLSYYDKLIDSIKFFQEIMPFGFIGSTILDKENTNNNLFRFKHDFIVHTLEDEILLNIIKAMRENKIVSFINSSKRSGNDVKFRGFPLRIFVSTQTGRRYLCMYHIESNRFINMRLDSIIDLKLEEVFENHEYIKSKTDKNFKKNWGVSFGNKNRIEEIYIKLRINEDSEKYIINRLINEGRGGEITKIKRDIFLYSRKCFDINEMATWIKTFIGRIISIEGTNKFVINKLYKDIERMYKMYFEDVE